MNLTENEFNRARERLLRMHFESGVGHIGGNLSAIDVLLVLFHEYLANSDRFILSKGHAAGALYVTLWTMGRLSDDDLKTFHKNGTLLPGHPPVTGLRDIAFATGSLGHGLSLAAGTAMAWKLQLRQDRVFCLTSDGEWQEGSTWEALIFAKHHNLSNLTVLVDLNGLQGFGSTAEVASMSALKERIEGFGVEVTVVNGHNPESLRDCLAYRSQQLQVVLLETIKGKGVDFMENEMAWHYLPLTDELYERALSSVSGNVSIL